MTTSRHRLFLHTSILAAYLMGTSAVARDSSPDSSEPPAKAEDAFALDLESLFNAKVTTASKFSEKLSEAPGMISVVTQDELRRFGGLTLSEILERVPGLSLSTASFTDRSIIAARGDQTKINGGHVLFLINGRPTREVLEGGLVGDLLASFPVGVLERIEVIKGPGSVLYGSNAFSAVINLITRKAAGNEIVVSGLSGGANGVATSGQLMLQKGALNVVGAMQFHQEPNWVAPVWSLYGGTANFTIPERGKGAYLGINYKGLSFMSSFTESKTSYIEGAVGDGRWRRGFADLGYTLKPNGNWDMSFNATFTRATLSAEKSIPFINRISDELVLEWSNVVTLTPKDQLTFGALFNRASGVENFVATTPAMVISTGSRPGEGLYAQLDHELLRSVKLIGGFQANKIGDLKLDVVPRAGVVWNPASRFSFKALYSGAFRAPSLNEMFLNYVPPAWVGGPSLLGAKNLLPEKVATIDVGVRYQGNRFQAGLGYFHSKMTNNIVLADQVTEGHYVNLGEATFRGVELDGKWYFSKSFFLTASSIYQTNRDDDGNTNITPIANFGAKAGISYESEKRFAAGIFDVHQGPIHGYSGSVNPMPGVYDLLNAHLRYDVTKHFASVSRSTVAFVVHANNLTNKALWLPDWKDQPGDSIFFNQGRTIYAGIEVSLKLE